MAVRPVTGRALELAYPRLAERDLTLPSMVLARLRDRVIRIGSDLRPTEAVTELEAALAVSCPEAGP